MVDLKLEDSKLLNEKLMFSVVELTKIAPISKPTIYKEIRAGRLLVTKLGKRTVFLAHNVHKWLKNLPTGPYTAK